MRQIPKVLSLLRETVSRHIIGLDVDEDGRQAKVDARITITRIDAVRPAAIRAVLERDLPMVVRVDRIDFVNACTCGRDAETGEDLTQRGFMRCPDPLCLIHGTSDASDLKFPELVYGAGVEPIGRSVPDHLPCKHSFTTVDGAMWVCERCGLGRDAEAMRIAQGVNLAVTPITFDDPREYCREGSAVARGNAMEAALGMVTEELRATREILGRREVELEQLRRKAKR
jgi:hypothetical protein